jgi:hypothetical protein
MAQMALQNFTEIQAAAKFAAAQAMISMLFY